MDPQPPRCSGADPNPGWTSAPWANVHHPSLEVRQDVPGNPAATGTMPPPPPRFGDTSNQLHERWAPNASTSDAAIHAALAPVGWRSYFTDAFDLQTQNDDVFRVYTRIGGKGEGTTDGGNTDGETEKKSNASNKTIVLFAHGCGYTGLSWACTIGLLAGKVSGDMLLAAFDARGHGETKTASNGDSTEVDFSADRLARDVLDVSSALVKSITVPRTSNKQSFKPVNVVFVGHSMGGAAVARAANVFGAGVSGTTDDSGRDNPGINDKLFTLSGVVVVDVVEGTAMESLPFMEAGLSRIPTSFDTMQTAIKWTMKSGFTTSLESAKVSTPSRLFFNAENDGGSYEWRTNVAATAKDWRSWFLGLSQIFLTAKCAKLLLLAGTDRLDNPLTIAQMQGKFQLVVLPKAGHAVHEDDPEKVAIAIAGFLKRYV